MRLARGSRDHPAVVAEATAVAADTVAAAKVASEEATRNSHTALGYFCSPGKVVCPAVTGVAELRVIALKTPRRNDTATSNQRFDESLGRAGFEPAKA
jgi:hypothetical protein